MNESNAEFLPEPVNVRVRIDGSQVALIKTERVGNRATYLDATDLPLPVNSYIELWFTDGPDWLVVPAFISEIQNGELVASYEQIADAFTKWRQDQMTKRGS